MLFTCASLTCRAGITYIFFILFKNLFAVDNVNSSLYLAYALTCNVVDLIILSVLTYQTFYASCIVGIEEERLDLGSNVQIAAVGTYRRLQACCNLIEAYLVIDALQDIAAHGSTRSLVNACQQAGCGSAFLCNIEELDSLKASLGKEHDGRVGRNDFFHLVEREQLASAEATV